MNAKNLLLILLIILGVMAISSGVAYYLAIRARSPGSDYSPPPKILSEADKLKVLGDLSGGSGPGRAERLRILESLFNK